MGATPIDNNDADGKSGKLYGWLLIIRCTRNMYQYGAKWTAVDISENQIEQAKILSKGMDIDYHVISTEDISFLDNSFDVITACQCFWYFDHEIVMPKFYRMLKQGGSILVLILMLI